MTPMARPPRSLNWMLSLALLTLPVPSHAQ